MTALTFIAQTPVLAYRFRLKPVPPSKEGTIHIRPRVRRVFPIATASSSDGYDGDQWGQYEQRDTSSLIREQEIACAFPHRQRHTHIFINEGSFRAFRPAAKRFIDSARATVAASLPSQTGDDVKRTDIQPPGRLWLMRSVADPTFGLLRGVEPKPPRCMVIQSLTSENTELFDVPRWVNALNRATKLSPMDAHSVDWALCHTVGPGSIDSGGVKQPQMEPGWYTGSETLNANWGKVETISAMREQLIEHAEEVVAAGFANYFEVFQSIDSPTCFKTLEVYKKIEDLEAVMTSLDEPFDKTVQKNRAAVNRVRQLHQCWESV